MKFKMRAGCFAAALMMILTLAQSATAATATTITEAPETVTTQASLSSADSEPSDDMKTFVITVNNGEGTILEQPDSMMFWEHPELPAGQLREGTLEVANQCDKEVTYSLDHIDLPYTDKVMLTYLASLHITVSDADGSTLYDGPFSGISGADGLSIKNVTLQPNESRKYHIAIQCAFAFAGDSTQINSQVMWYFKASSTTIPPKGVSGTSKILITVIIAVLVVCVLLALIQWIRRRKNGIHMKHKAR